MHTLETKEALTRVHNALTTQIEKHRHEQLEIGAMPGLDLENRKKIIQLLGEIFGLSEAQYFIDLELEG